MAATAPVYLCAYLPVGLGLTASNTRGPRGRPPDARVLAGHVDVYAQEGKSIIQWKVYIIVNVIKRSVRNHVY